MITEPISPTSRLVWDTEMAGRYRRLWEVPRTVSVMVAGLAGPGAILVKTQDQLSPVHSGDTENTDWNKENDVI